MHNFKRMVLVVSLLLVGYLIPAQADNHESIRIQSERPVRVNLWGRQSRVKDQGDRGTCIAHSSIAALEAAYMRAGYERLDLSEEFAIYSTKMFWLEPNGTHQPFAAENMPGFLSGGFGSGYIHQLANGFGVPSEKAMPYRTRYPQEPRSKDELSSNWAFQFEVDRFNLHPRRFNSVALSKATYYGVKSYRDLSGRDTDQIEAALAAGREVVWDFIMPVSIMPRDKFSPTEWVVDPQYAGFSGGHSVLIVGYDRTDPAQPVFLIKNSWKGKERIRASYEFVRRFGLASTVITEIVDPHPWNELAGLGRWYLEINGRKGILDLYHMPGMALTNFKSFGIRDSKGNIMHEQRIGTFFLDGNPLKAYRVNGSLTKAGVTILLDWENANLPYGSMNQSTKLTFRGAAKAEMTGKGTRAVRLTSNSAFDEQGCELAELPEIKNRVSIEQRPERGPVNFPF